MDNIKNVLITAGVSLVVVVGSWMVFGPSDGMNGRDGQDGRVGAIAGPDIISPYLKWGDVAVFSANTDEMNQASTTVCALQSPTNATSTLVHAAAHFEVMSTTTTGIITLARSNSNAASTTAIGSATLAANVKDTIFASSTATQAYTFAPGQYLTVSVKGQAQFYPTGTCQATWIAI